ncbi:helix-turn-helix domain-containing protein [Salinarimonas rosea]|uniref:helix-turn-helix domain-containing protein n=1 Tax=Salinarimonas rosea TaxID=552063 RepID=UPI0024735B20|nr:helix-turn-helix transcriptional regulator [Salinarimonas rosea]
MRAFRMGRGLTPEDVAARIGISRAALYRAEQGQIPKIETLAGIADVLDTSLASLLGAGIEYVPTAVAFFERMRQLEEASHEVVGLFGPVSYLLTSDAYDAMLAEVLREGPRAGRGAGDKDGAALETLLTVLRERKAWFRAAKPAIVSLISSSDIERFLAHGAVGRYDLDEATILRRRREARREVEHIAALVADPPANVEIGIVLEPTPATTFQIFRQPDRSVLAISPFRLGEQPNVSLGVALITSAPEPMALHEEIAARLRASALRGDAALAHLRALVARHGVEPA